MTHQVVNWVALALFWMLCYSVFSAKHLSDLRAKLSSAVQHTTNMADTVKAKIKVANLMSHPVLFCWNQLDMVLLLFCSPIPGRRRHSPWHSCWMSSQRCPQCQRSTLEILEELVGSISCNMGYEWLKSDLNLYTICNYSDTFWDRQKCHYNWLCHPILKVFQHRKVHFCDV